MWRVPEQRRHGSTVVAVVDATDSSLEGVVQAAREANHRKIPLELELARAQRPLTRRQRARYMQRVDAAVELARRVAPGLEVRLPYQNPLGDPAPTSGPS